MHYFLILLLPVAATFGWVAAVFSGHAKDDGDDDLKKKPVLPRDYLKGLNFLLNEEPDKALDVFIRMLEVDSETIETHLALGNLFRRRGEVQRAIRIHQNLIARPNLDRTNRATALFALAKDYLKAGVLDRAERLLLELLDMNVQHEAASKCLLDIYQQEKEWEKAIEIAKNLGSAMNPAIAHYYCELAELRFKAKDHVGALKLLKRAFHADKLSVRASLLLAKVEQAAGRHKHALRHLKRVRSQDSDFFAEAIVGLVDNYRALGKEAELLLYFRGIIKDFPKIPVAIILSEQIRKWRGDKAAAGFVADYVRKHPSVEGLHRLVELHLTLVDDQARKDLLILKSLTEKILKDHPSYQCKQCGFSSKTLHWLCPSCRRFNTIKPTHVLASH